MKITITLLTSLLLGLSPVLRAAGPSSVDDLKWLTGCWASVGGETGSGEQWTIPAGNTLFGVSRTVHGGKTVAYEFMQIRSTENGEIEFIAKPSGQTGASFLMKSLTENEVVFENPAHDFPQRVIYRLKAPGNLEASIEGHVKGEGRTINFSLKRIGCAGKSLKRFHPKPQQTKLPKTHYLPGHGLAGP
jgi:hypothetical protein